MAGRIALHRRVIAMEGAVGLWIAVVCLLVVTGAVLLTGAGGSSGTVTETGTQPFVNIQAFSHEGELAFVSRGSLWVLDGPAGSLRKVASTSFTTNSHLLAGVLA